MLCVKCYVVMLKGSWILSLEGLVITNAQTIILGMDLKFGLSSLR